MKLVRLFNKARLYIVALPIALLVLGAAMNQAVLVANGGKFPVMVNEQVAIKSVDGNGFFDDGDQIHCRMNEITRLNWLGDYINTHVRIMSPGDLLIEFGEFLGSYSLTIWMTMIVMDVSNREKALA